MTAARTPSASPRRSIRRRFFSTDMHPAKVITDVGHLYRYQGYRLLVAEAGAALAGAGLGFSWSHGGGFRPEWEVALGVPALVGVALAALFVMVPLWEAFRIAATVAVLGLFIYLGLETGLDVKIVMSVVGLVVSLGLAALLARFTRVFTGTFRDFAEGMLALTLLGGAVATLVLAADIPAASAQAGACTDERLVLVADGVAHTRDGRDTTPVVIEVDGGVEQIVVSVESRIERGNVVIRVVETDSIPSWVADATGSVVWSGEIRDGEVEAEPIVIAQDNGTYRIRSSAHSADLHLIAGQATYQATISDGVTECVLDAVVRINADPWTTWPGRVALAGATLGTGLLGGSVLAESARVLRRTKPRVSNAERSQQPGGGTKWTFLAHVELEEKNYDPEKINSGEIRFRDVIGFKLGAVVRRGISYQLPLQIALSPEAVALEIGAFELTCEGDSIGWIAVNLGGEGIPPSVRLLPGSYIDLTGQEIAPAEPKLEEVGS